ncbi:hypothetical protein [Catenuloplanes atrovinosus]|uniref:Uncharacterized protein n=1 Tax=Catenuloplanes atrovinosus TaxID=137266 RepID=A0AAE4C8R5_9ACTN|nr:hypothetical protein [Catenuloplanes atrovinosus]MDR7275801.1 hypothetical protein [Catenuloplanes atrovinosus]
MRTRIAAGTAVLAIMSMGACASPGERAGGGQPSPAASLGSSWESCAAAGAPRPIPPERGSGMIPPINSDQGGGPRLPEDFTPVAVTVCDGEERRGDDPAAVAALAAALRLPDLPGTAEACTLEALILPWFVLHDANGAWIRPGVPFDECRKPRREVLDALDPFRGGPPAIPPGSALSVRTGCSDTHADMIAVTSGRGTDAEPAGPPAADADLRLCLYQVDESELGSGKPAGTLRAGAVLTAQAWSAVRAAFPPAAKAAPCTARSTSFALLQPVSGAGPATYVELSGCGRTMRDGAGLAAGDPRLTAAIEQAATG